MLKSDRTRDGVLISTLTNGSEKEVDIICDGCGVESIAIFFNFIRSSRKWGRGKSFCRSCASKRTGDEKRGKKINAGPSPNRQGKKSGNWGGGRWIASDGYVMLYVGPRLHRKEHFLVMERWLQRPLQKGEVVHHIDTDKQNNLLDNLILLRNEKEHQKVHNSLRKLAGFLVQRGLIGFDRKENGYLAVGKLRELLEQPEEANQQPSEGGDPLEGSTTR